MAKAQNRMRAAKPAEVKHFQFSRRSVYTATAVMLGVSVLGVSGLSAFAATPSQDTSAAAENSIVLEADSITDAQTIPELGLPYSVEPVKQLDAASVLAPAVHADGADSETADNAAQPSTDSSSAASHGVLRHTESALGEEEPASIESAIQRLTVAADVELPTISVETFGVIVHEPEKPAQGAWVRPSEGIETSGFGAREEICNGSMCTGGAAHTGTDLASGEGTPIFAASAGTVTFSGAAPSYGNMIEIDHGNGIKTRYGHIMDGGLFVTKGQVVAAGDKIAGVGSTGMSTGNHLHFEVFVDGSHVDPEIFMKEHGVTLDS